MTNYDSRGRVLPDLATRQRVGRAGGLSRWKKMNKKDRSEWMKKVRAGKKFNSEEFKN